jgi:hypothetical protein
MHQGAVEQAAGDEHFSQDLALAVEREEMKFLDLQVPQPSLKQAGDVLGFPDPNDRRALFAGQSVTQLEGRKQPGRLRGPDTVCP